MQLVADRSLNLVLGEMLPDFSDQDMTELWNSVELTMFERGYLLAADLGFILVAGSEIILPPLELGEIERATFGSNSFV